MSDVLHRFRKPFLRYIEFGGPVLNFMGLKQADSASILRTRLGEIIWHAFSPLEATRWRVGKFPMLPFVAPEPIPPAFSWTSRQRSRFGSQACRSAISRAVPGTALYGRVAQAMDGADAACIGAGASRHRPRIARGAAQGEAADHLIGLAFSPPFRRCGMGEQWQTRCPLCVTSARLGIAARLSPRPACSEP
jgi:hypothetical protein